MKNRDKDKWDHTSQILSLINNLTQTLRAVNNNKPNDLQVQDFHPFQLETTKKSGGTSVKDLKGYFIKGNVTLPPLPPL